MRKVPFLFFLAIFTPPSCAKTQRIYHLDELIKNETYEIIIETLQNKRYVPSEVGKTPLHYAVLYYDGKDDRLINYLLANGANPNAFTTTCQELPIHQAQNLRVVKLLAAAGANVNGVNCNGLNILHALVYRGKVSLTEVRYLVEELRVDPLAVVKGDGFCRAIDLSKDAQIIKYLEGFERQRKRLETGINYRTSQTLVVYDTPNLKGKKIATLAKGELVNVKENTEIIQTLAGTRRVWVLIEFGNKRNGFVFGGFLKPEYDCAAFKDF